MSTQRLDHLLRVEELAHRWQVTKFWIYRNAEELGIPSIRLGGNIRFALEDILQYEESCKLNPKRSPD